MAKKRNNKRAKQRAKILQDMENRLLLTLHEISDGLGLTIRERVEVQVDYYFTCNPVEREFLMKIFKNYEDRVLTDLAYKG